MKKTDIFHITARIISTECEIPVDRILSKSRDVETVDARYLLIYFLSKQGLYPNCIAKLIGRTARSVTGALSKIDDRKQASRYFRNKCETIKI